MNTKIKINKKKGLVYTILLIIPFGIPIIFILELFYKLKQK